MKKIIIILISFMFGLLACNKGDEVNNFDIDVGIKFYFEDELGNDLLDPQNANAIDESQIRVLRLIDGEWKEPYEAHLDYPKLYRFIHENGLNYLQVSLECSLEPGQYPEPLIKWNESDIDTIKCEARESRTKLEITKVWLNNELVWDDFAYERSIVIVKK